MWMAAFWPRFESQVPEACDGSMRDPRARGMDLRRGRSKVKITAVRRQEQVRFASLIGIVEIPAALTDFEAQPPGGSEDQVAGAIA